MKGRGNGKELNNAQKTKHQQQDQNRDDTAPAETYTTVVITAAAEQKHQHNDNHEKVHNGNCSPRRRDYQWGLHPIVELRSQREDWCLMLNALRAIVTLEKTRAQMKCTPKGPTPLTYQL